MYLDVVTQQVGMSFQANLQVVIKVTRSRETGFSALVLVLVLYSILLKLTPYKVLGRVSEQIVLRA